MLQNKALKQNQHYLSFQANLQMPLSAQGRGKNSANAKDVMDTLLLKALADEKRN